MRWCFMDLFLPRGTLVPRDSPARRNASYLSPVPLQAAQARQRLALEADFFGVGEDVFLDAGADARLLARPVRRVHEVGVALEEHVTRLRIAHQEARELLGKYVVRAHRVVGLGRH